MPYGPVRLECAYGTSTIFLRMILLDADAVFFNELAPVASGAAVAEAFIPYVGVLPKAFRFTR